MPGFVELIRNRVAPALFERGVVQGTLRAWVPNCGTGEPAYGLAMLLHDEAVARNQHVRILVFGTEAVPDPLQRARHAQYPADALEGAPRSVGARHLQVDGDRCTVQPPTRQLCVLASHDLSKDPPYSNLDIVFVPRAADAGGRPVGERALSLFHFALAPNGVLVVPPGAEVPGMDALFEPDGSGEGAYRPRQRPGGTMLPGLVPDYATGPPNTLAAWRAAREVKGSADQYLLSRYAPPSVVVDPNDEVLQIRGDVSGLLTVRSGPATLRFVELVAAELAAGFERLKTRAAQTAEPVYGPETEVPGPRGPRTVKLEVVPLNEAPRPHMLVLFHERGGPGRRERPQDGALARLWSLLGRRPP